MPRPKKTMDEFTLEKLKISDTLRDIDKKLTIHIERFDHHCEKDEMMQTEIKRICVNHDKLLLGTNGVDGMKVRIDRLEQKEKWRAIMYGAIWVAICGLVTKAVWSALTLTAQ